MKIQNIIEELSSVKVTGNTDRIVTGLTFDSRDIHENELFVAVKGTIADGHDFIDQAISRGASSILCETVTGEIRDDITYLVVPDTRIALGQIASLYYGHPSRELKLIGITGTNGKTTTATLLYNLNISLGYSAGLLSTIEIRINGRTFTATHTTPDPLKINYYLRKMVDAGCEYCFMEVSSHAVSQERIAGLTFRGGVFTNLTHDHLDYHSSFKEYLEAKKSFFDRLSVDAFALVNKDDRNGKVMIQNTAATVYTYSLTGSADFKGRIIEMGLDGTHIDINGKELWTRLPGKFNVSNILAVYGTAFLSGHAETDILRAISEMGPVRGRFEIIRGQNNILAVIDYAHTPDALLNVLQTISEVLPRGSKVLTVVGAGGNRDRTKRPKLAQIAVAYSNRVILTSDNPRNEDPEVIIAEMAAGLTESQMQNVMRITGREDAIKTACMLAGPGDVILVAGKGHEAYQEIKGRRYPFGDVDIVRKNLK
ncbi:MAG: UDP-N-acetylmuramoyl-L-alanyl-D-glutamate--2,6-diaminopimelate ligase [Bacteroidales bacterium]|nr:UDP-N-acetylmuramoyl-L-alanyl-D-glutamate--2,6-diaminopimelate ligase [Bacteroidales bacterium]MBN2699716.1 UDP-N-acetylmuramoyl-L-alanyl-D-glutamate--2,6-diaminopimelate ligase [Bacteroidales bacterium]